MRHIKLDQVDEVANYLRQRAEFGATEAERRDAAACLLGLQGLRISEVAAARVRDWRRRDNTLFVRTLKGGRAGRIKIAPGIASIVNRFARRNRRLMLKLLICTASGKGITPRNLRRRWRSWSKIILGEPKRFHDLRHTCAQVVWERSGHDIFAVQSALRHTKLKNTVIYLQFSRNIEEFLPDAQQPDRTNAETIA